MKFNTVIGYGMIAISLLSLIVFMFTQITNIMLLSLFAAIHGKINYDWGKEEELRK